MERNPFGEWLRLCTDAELEAWRKRALEAGNNWLAVIFEDELCDRAYATHYPEKP